MGRVVTLGTLVDEADLARLAGEDLAGLFGGFLVLADALRRDPKATLQAWRARLLLPFDPETEEPAAPPQGEAPPSAVVT